MGKRPSEHAEFLTRQQRRFRNLRRRLLGWAMRPMFWLLPRLPLSVLRGIGAAASWPLYLMFRRGAVERARASFGESDEAALRRIVRGSCASVARTMAESLYATHHGLAPFADQIDDADARARIAAFDRAHAHGWVAVSGHIGNWELMAIWLESQCRARPLIAVAKRNPNPSLNRQIENLRGKSRLETLYQDESPARAIRAIREQRIVGLVADQDVKSLSGAFIDFLGRSAYTPIGPARLAIAARAPIMCLFMVRDESDRLKMIINDPIWPDPELSRQEQIIQLTRDWSTQVEAVVRRYPDQWPWLHDRWKTTVAKLEARGRPRL